MWGPFVPYCHGVLEGLNPFLPTVAFSQHLLSERLGGGTSGAPIMPRDAVSRTANVERTGRHKWVKHDTLFTTYVLDRFNMQIDSYFFCQYLKF